MLLAFARRTVRILPQVRLIRSPPLAESTIPPSRGDRRARAKADDAEETLIVGETIEVKYERFPKDKMKNFLEDPSVMTLVKQHRVDFEAKEEPKVGYSDEDLALFDSIAEIKIDDALQDFQKSSFDAEFLDSVGPGLKPTFNVAALADKHEVIKQLVAMNVAVYRWDEKPEVLKRMLSLNWDKDCRPRIEFLTQECGVEPEGLSRILSRNPLLLTEEMQHLEARLEFLRDKKAGLGLRKHEISRVLSKEAYWLSSTIENIENRINFFRNQFAIDKHGFKTLLVSRPSILMVQLRKMVVKKFNMIEEMGFDQAEMRKAILNGPKVLTMSSEALVERFQVLHLDMGYSHELIAAFPRVLYCRASRLRERHAFLKHLGRAQYDPQLPGYISPQVISRGSDEDFVENVAKSTKEKFEHFIKNF